MIPTNAGVPIGSQILANYFRTLIGLFFKILPLRESEEPTLGKYVRSLQCELIGCKRLISVLEFDGRFIELISILQYFIDNPDCEVEVVKREVFHAINILNSLSKKYGEKFEIWEEHPEAFERELERINKLRDRGDEHGQRVGPI